MQSCTYTVRLGSNETGITATTQRAVRLLVIALNDYVGLETLRNLVTGKGKGKAIPLQP